MRLVVDAHLPPALARWLVARGHDAVHVFNLDYARAPDSVIWEHARETGSVRDVYEFSFQRGREDDRRGTAPNVLPLLDRPYGVGRRRLGTALHRHVSEA